MKKALCLSLGFLMLWTSVLQAEVRIEITFGIDSARPIAVLPFQGNRLDNILEDIGNIIAADLRNSGKFNPLNRTYLPQQISTVQEIKPDVWSKLGIDLVIVGKIMSMPDGDYHVAYQLLDVSRSPEITGTILAENLYKIKKHWIRYVAHTISDEVFEKLTGIKGAFRTRIAYIVQTNDVQFPYELRVSDYDGYNSFIVYRSLQPLMSPAWSPDGSKLAYVTFESGKSALVIHTLSNGEIRQIASFPRHNGAPAFSPDGTKLAFSLSKTGSLNLYVMDLNSGQIHQVTNCRSNNTEPTWCPDNQNLIFTSDQGGRPQLYKVNINGGLMERITWKYSQNQDANISSDGKIMVMVSTSDGEQHIAKQDLVTGDVQILSSTFLDETPSLSPNGTMVIYRSSQEMRSVLNLVSTDGRFKTCLPETNGTVKSPSWSPYL